MLLGRLFKYLHRKEQIGTFLSAIVDNRVKRIADCQRAERLNPATFSLPAGVEHARYLKTTVQHIGSDGLISLTEEVCGRDRCGIAIPHDYVAVHTQHVLVRPRGRG